MVPLWTILLVPTEITWPPTVAWLPGAYVELAITTPPLDAGAAVLPATTTGLGLATTTGLFTAVAGALATGEFSAGAFPAGAFPNGEFAAAGSLTGALTGETAGCPASVGAAIKELEVPIRTEW